jgi:hypothetical protein
MYWSHEPRATRQLKALRLDTAPWPPAAWRVAAKDLKRDVNQKKEIYLEANDSFLNWIRLSAVMALSGYLELFLRESVSAALESAPAVSLGAPHAVDGVSLLKVRSGYGGLEQANQVAEGSWQSRLAGYERLFGSTPADLKAHEKSLDELRRMRNAVGHHFGRKAEGFDFGINPRRAIAERVSEERLLRWMQTANEAALAIEKHLLPLIGDYETIRYFHAWRSSYKGNFHTERNDFKWEINRIGGPKGGKDYFSDLIEYYKSA